MVSVITKGSVDRLGLATGDAVTVVIKSTEVMLEMTAAQGRRVQVTQVGLRA